MILRRIELLQVTHKKRDLSKICYFVRDIRLFFGQVAVALSLPASGKSRFPTVQLLHNERARIENELLKHSFNVQMCIRKCP